MEVSLTPPCSPLKSLLLAQPTSEREASGVIRRLLPSQLTSEHEAAAKASGVVRRRFLAQPTSEHEAVAETTGVVRRLFLAQPTSDHEEAVLLTAELSEAMHPKSQRAERLPPFGLRQWACGARPRPVGRARHTRGEDAALATVLHRLIRKKTRLGNLRGRLGLAPVPTGVEALPQPDAAPTSTTSLMQMTSG